MSYIDATDTSLRKTGQIKQHGPSGFAGMRKAGALVSKCLDALTDIVKPGVPTSEIDEFVRKFAFDHGAYPATLMYRGYRYSTCTSINHVVCHGMPGDRPLKEGDIVNVDVTFIVDGWYGDSSRMYAIGAIARKAERLIEVTYEAMMRGIAAVKPGATTGDIGHAIQSFVEPQGMSVVGDFCGHGLGRPLVKPKLDVIGHLVGIADDDGARADVSDDEIAIGQAIGAFHVTASETHDIGKQPLAALVGLCQHQGVDR